MPSNELSREELFALVWEKPTQEVAKELGVSDTQATRAPPLSSTARGFAKMAHWGSCRTR